MSQREATDMGKRIEDLKKVLPSFFSLAGHRDMGPCSGQVAPRALRGPCCEIFLDIRFFDTPNAGPLGYRETSNRFNLCMVYYDYFARALT